MATFQAKTDRKQISIILNLMKFDCVDLYKKFHTQKSQLKQALELYETFMTDEINTLFQCNNNFSDMVMNHRKKFQTFIDDITTTIVAGQIQTNGKTADDKFYVIFISLQEWFIQGCKGQQFYFMIDIDSFGYKSTAQNFAFRTKKTAASTTRQTNGIETEKKARIVATDFKHQTFIAFKADEKFDCDIYTKKNIMQSQHFLKKKYRTDIMPTKCVLMLLKRLYYGVNHKESNEANTYTSNITVNYDLQFTATSNISKIDAQNLAALEALQTLCQVENKFVRNKRNDNYPQNFAENIQKLVTDGFKQYCPNVDLDNKSNVLASVIQTEGIHLNTAKIVVLSTGTKNIDADELFARPDTSLPDTHAEVVARRCLMSYFYDQLNEFLSGTSHRSIFEKSPYSSQIKLKENIRFHLYINKGPCGDSTIFGKYGNSSGHPHRDKLRTKVEKSMGLELIENIKEETQNGSSLQIQPLYTMSCSDKIARWNVVGVQGALLSRIIEPIYFDSVVLGQMLSVDPVKRSFYGRIEHSIGYLPQFYYHNEPHIAFCDAGVRNVHHGAPHYSYNWIIGSNRVEEVESKSGKLKYDHGISRLSKRLFFRKFLNIIQRLPHIACDRTDTGNVLYAREKAKAEDYQNAKDALIDAFNRLDLGNWKKAQKPSEIDEGIFEKYSM